MLLDDELVKHEMSFSLLCCCRADTRRVEYDVIGSNENAAVVDEDAGKRKDVVDELLRTEVSYTGDLRTLLYTYKAKIEETGEDLMSHQDVKRVFGDLVPIHEVHVRLLGDLERRVNNWQHTDCVADIILQHADALSKSYPSFVNYLDESRRILEMCCKLNPRFREFLQSCAESPECRRQTLHDMVVTPMQRPLRIVLLLERLLKYTPPQRAGLLQDAINSMKKVASRMDEGKGKTDNYVEMFHIVQTIDQCPASLLSAHRHVVCKIDGVLLTSERNSPGQRVGLKVAIFFFNDCIEVCRRHSDQSKALEHLVLLQMSSVTRFLNFLGTADCGLSFGLQYIGDSGEESLVAFKMTSYTVNKRDTVVTDDVAKRTVLGLICQNLGCESLMVEADAKDFKFKSSPAVYQMFKETTGKALAMFKRESPKISSSNEEPQPKKPRVPNSFHGHNDTPASSKTKVKATHTDSDPAMSSSSSSSSHTN